MADLAVEVPDESLVTIDVSDAPDLLGGTRDVAA